MSPRRCLGAIYMTYNIHDKEDNYHANVFFLNIDVRHLIYCRVQCDCCPSATPAHRALGSRVPISHRITLAPAALSGHGSAAPRGRNRFAPRESESSGFVAPAHRPHYHRIYSPLLYITFICLFKVGYGGRYNSRRISTRGFIELDAFRFGC